MSAPAKLFAALVASTLVVAAGCEQDADPAALARMEEAASARSAWQGRKAPQFTLVDQNGQRRSLADQEGKWTVVYFYPKDDTPGCVCQATEFTDLLYRFEQLDADVWGINSDSVESHRTFTKKHDLRITLLSDLDRRVMKQYGAWADLPSDTGQTGRIVRTTFLIGPDGIVREHWPEVFPTGHADRVRQRLAELRSQRQASLR